MLPPRAIRQVPSPGFTKYRDCSRCAFFVKSDYTGTTTSEEDFVKYPFGCAKFDYMVRQVPLPTTPDIYGRVPLPSPKNRQVYLYLVFGIAKNVKYPFEMTRSASSNDPKYLFETTEYYYHRTLERLLPLLPTTTAP